MNFEKTLLISLVVVSLLSMVSYAYLVYAVHGDATTNTTGKAIVKSHTILFSIPLALMILQMVGNGFVLIRK